MKTLEETTTQLVRYNGGIRCDVYRGHCNCGAAHGEWDRPRKEATQLEMWQIIYYDLKLEHEALKHEVAQLRNKLELANRALEAEHE